MQPSTRSARQNDALTRHAPLFPLGQDNRLRNLDSLLGPRAGAEAESLLESAAVEFAIGRSPRRGRKSAVVIAITLGFRPVSGACAATTQDAKPCHVVTPEPVKW